MDAEPGDAPAAGAFESLDRVFELKGTQVSSGILCHVIKWCVAGRNYYVKRYSPRGKHFRKVFSRNRPVVEWRNLTYFARMGIPVPRVVAYGSQYRLGLLRRGALVTEEVPQAVDLQTLVKTKPELLQDRAWVLAIMRLLTEYVRRIHEDGFTHRDLKWRNVLVTEGSAPHVVFLDCPSGRHTPRPWRAHFIARDLADLDRSGVNHLSRTMRLRFYLWCRGRTHLGPEDKRFIAKVTALRIRRERATSSRRSKRELARRK
ncbi:MAG TPA: lipopolysaccharide kinase InaA family protein [Sedimentisphaerales bacterium]|nr:lipopolysaccharide kinase InaA family protein [Sedimentisphaerales bacterium]